VDDLILQELGIQTFSNEIRVIFAALAGVHGAAGDVHPSIKRALAAATLDQDGLSGHQL
jgi:hypothetical protein